MQFKTKKQTRSGLPGSLGKQEIAVTMPDQEWNKRNLGFCGIAIAALFEQKSARHIFINGGYQVVTLTVMGATIGAGR